MMNELDLAKKIWVKSLQEFNLEDFNQNDHLSLLENFEFYSYHLLNYQAQWKLIENFGPIVLSGPFQGLIFPLPQVIHDVDHLLGKNGGASFISKYLLGTYESELHSAIQEISNNDYEVIVDLGCSLGYYAAGFGRMFPSSMIYAYDNNEDAITLCKELIAHNGMLERTKFGGLWFPSDFQTVANKRALVFCDIEGAELDLFNMDSIENLKHADLIIESHDVFNPKISSEILRKFELTHDFQIYRNNQYKFNLPEQSKILTDLELAACLNEMRNGDTPWILLKSKLMKT